MKNIRAILLKNGVRNLHEFGYPDANDTNILTDMMYSAIFLSMLKDEENAPVQALPECQALIKELEASR